MDYVKEGRGAAIGGRLRRLSERIDHDAAQVYANLGVTFEQRWFGVLNQLALHGAMTVGGLATALGITHVSVSQTRLSLEKAGLILQEADSGDARRRRLSLSPAGQALVAKLGGVWAALNAAALEIDREANGVVEALDRLEAALDRHALADRVAAIMSEDKP